ncbi:MAG: T9SS type A sorting domain-containing protein, partial [Cytophagales bacterium]|nr:T9SS type A sorting domain-containing protein [Cytophagales bacterium]
QFTNINIGQVYEYKFKMMPIAYTWAEDHKIKILITSSNFTRFQVNPNLPIEDGDFFRRKPGDGQTYVFNGAAMSPRTAVQRISFSDIYPTNIDLPVYFNSVTSIDEETTAIKIKLDALIYPNPSTDNISIYMNRNGSYEVSVINVLGQKIFNAEFKDQININVSDFGKGMYFAEIRSLKGNSPGLDGTKIVRKISVL